MYIGNRQVFVFVQNYAQTIQVFVIKKEEGLFTFTRNSQEDANKNKESFGSFTYRVYNTKWSVSTFVEEFTNNSICSILE